MRIYFNIPKQGSLQNTNAKQAFYSTVWHISAFTVLSVWKYEKESLNTFLNNQVNPPLQTCPPHHLEASVVARYLPGCFLSRRFSPGSGFVSQSCRVKASATVEASLYVREETRTRFQKAAGGRGRPEISSSSCQPALKQKVEPLPPQATLLFDAIVMHV